MTSLERVVPEKLHLNFALEMSWQDPCFQHYTTSSSVAASQHQETKTTKMLHFNHPRVWNPVELSVCVMSTQWSQGAVRVGESCVAHECTATKARKVKSPSALLSAIKLHHPGLLYKLSLIYCWSCAKALPNYTHIGPLFFLSNSTRAWSVFSEDRGVFGAVPFL
jgi:hypothetical protein